MQKKYIKRYFYLTTEASREQAVFQHLLFGSVREVCRNGKLFDSCPINRRLLWLLCLCAPIIAPPIMHTIPAICGKGIFSPNNSVAKITAESGSNCDSLPVHKNDARYGNRESLFSFAAWNFPFASRNIITNNALPISVRRRTIPQRFIAIWLAAIPFNPDSGNADRYGSNAFVSNFDSRFHIIYRFLTGLITAQGSGGCSRL